MITIIAGFDVKPESVDKFIRLAADCTRQARKENGNLSYKVFRARYCETRFTFIEEWLNDTAIEKHNDMSYFKKFLEDIADLTNGEPSIEQIVKVPAIR